MVQVSRRAGFTDSALVRLLARLTNVDVPESRQSFSDQLSQWINWKDAISLYSALSGSPATATSAAAIPTVSTPLVSTPLASTPTASTRTAAASGNAEESEFSRVRTALTTALAEDGNLMRGESGSQAGSDTATIDFAPCRRRYLARQQAMAARIGPLRQRLRTALEAGSPAMAQLAALDTIMEQALGAHEQRLLSSVPALLEKHFRRLHQAAGEPDHEARPNAWLDVFCDDLQAVSLAELDTRLQPLEGLLEALRKNPARTY